MSKDKKIEFANEAHELSGRPLRAKMNAVCTQELHQTLSLLGDGVYLDSEDLERKYENEPEKFKLIKANTKSLT